MLILFFNHYRKSITGKLRQSKEKLIYNFLTKLGGLEMKKTLVGAILICSIFIFGCDIKGSKMDPELAKDCVEKITYVYDARVNICYAIVATRTTGSTYQGGIGLTIVPYEKVKNQVRPENIIR